MVDEGIVRNRVQQIAGALASSMAASNSGSMDSGSSSENSSATATLTSISIGGNNTVSNQLSQGADTFKSAGLTYAPQTQHLDMQWQGVQYFQQFGFEPRYQMEQNCYSKPTQNLMPSSGYVNMLPIQVQMSPMMISQPHPSETSHVFDPRNYQSQAIIEKTCLPVWTAPVATNIDSYRYSLVSNISQATPFVTYSNMSNPSVNCVPSPTSYRNSNIAPVFPFTAPEVSPVTQLNGKDLLNKTCSDRMSCSNSVAPVSSTHGSTNLKTAHESSAPGHVATQPLKVSSYYPDRAPMNYSENLRSTLLVSEKDEDFWPGTCKYVEFEQNPGSALFVTWFNSTSMLVGKLRYYKFEVRHIKRTSDHWVLNVVFESHAKARKAFTMQRAIRLHMVPPKTSHFKWFKNPSPRFLVKFELNRPLIIRKGKAESHDIVGELLTFNCNEQPRCFVWADQIKGHRIRVVSCHGNLKYQDGRVVKMTGISSKFEGVLEKGDKMPALGWIPYRSKYTKEMFVLRRSGNLLSDYIYKG